MPGFDDPKSNDSEDKPNNAGDLNNLVEHALSQIGSLHEFKSVLDTMLPPQLSSALGMGRSDVDVLPSLTIVGGNLPPESNGLKDLNENPATNNPASAVEVKQGSLSQKIAANAYATATTENTTGWCYRGVSHALAPLGVSLTGGSAYMAIGQLQRDDRFVEVDPGDLQPGDIIVHDKSDRYPDGHIAVVEPNGMEASDNVRKLIPPNSPGFGKAHVFRAIV